MIVKSWASDALDWFGHFEPRKESRCDCRSQRQHYCQWQGAIHLHRVSQRLSPLALLKTHDVYTVIILYWSVLYTFEGFWRAVLGPILPVSSWFYSCSSCCSASSCSAPLFHLVHLLHISHWNPWLCRRCHCKLHFLPSRRLEAMSDLSGQALFARKWMMNSSPALLMESGSTAPVWSGHVMTC